MKTERSKNGCEFSAFSNCEGNYWFKNSLKKMQFPHQIREREKNIKTRDTCGVLLGNLKGKTPLERHWRTWEDNIKMDFQEI